MSDEMIVCIIEDNLPIRKLFSTLLIKNGFKVIDFGNAGDGIEWLKKNIPSVIVLDILLPDMSGQDAIKIIRPMPGFDKVPVIAVTGFASDNDREKYLSSGFDYYMTKPVNVASFAQEVRNCIK